MQRILDIVEAHGTGLFFTIDEVSPRHEALATFGKRFQHFRRENRQVAFVAAGLPLNMSEFESLPDTTFMRRAMPHVLGDVPVSEARQALEETFAQAGREIGKKAARLAAEATQGYPFMVQLVGYHIWRESETGAVPLDAVHRGIAAAKTRVGTTVHSSSMRDLSTLDKEFLLAMTPDDGPSQMADITRRTGWSREKSNMYRSRLLTAGMIQTASHGVVQFAFPYLKDYLQENAARLVW
jgi:hypothetical protein